MPPPPSFEDALVEVAEDLYLQRSGGKKPVTGLRVLVSRKRPETAESVLTQGLRNIHQTGESSAAMVESKRAVLESQRLQLTIPIDGLDDLTPKSGYLDVDVSAQERSDIYGFFLFELHSQVLARTTFTEGDSLGWSGQNAPLVLWPSGDCNLVLEIDKNFGIFDEC